MKVIEFTGHQLATSGVYDAELDMTQEEINASLMAGGGSGQCGALFAMIAQSEAGWTSASPHSAGSFLIVDKKLFRALADIPSGAAIRPGANVAQTTILDALRSMIQAAQYAGGSPRCDQVTGFDFAGLCRIMSWDPSATNALYFSDDDLFGN